MFEVKKRIFEEKIVEVFNFYLLTANSKAEHFQIFEKEGERELAKFNKENGLNKRFRFKAFWEMKMKTVEWSSFKKERNPAILQAQKMNEAKKEALYAEE